MTGPKKLRWLAAGWDSPLHLCIEQGGVAATLCGAKPKHLFKTKPTSTRCQDCARIERARKAVRRAEIRIWLRSIPKRIGAWIRARSPRLIHVTINRDGRMEIVR